MISVIIPVYNAEKTIAKCIESVLCQTYQDFEILLINDGSPDNSEEVCLKYAEKDKRIRYIKKENGGVSTARNRGIDEAKGEYISFIDSDDWIEPEALESLHNAAIQYKADIVSPRCRGVYFLSDGSFEKYVLDNDDFVKVVSSKQVSTEFESLLKASLLYSVCGRLYLSNFLKKNALYFNPSIRVLEDFCFTLSCLSRELNFVHIDSITYNYKVINDGGYQFKREYTHFMNSVAYVEEVWFSFLKDSHIAMRASYYDFILSYWILAIQGVIKTETRITKRYALIRQIGINIQKHNLYRLCTKSNYDTQYKVLFITRSVLAFLLFDWLKKCKRRICGD